MAGKNSPNSMLSLLEGGAWRMVVAVALLAVVGAGLFFAWQKWGAPAVASRRKVTRESIQCPAAPPWIKTDLVQQAIRDGSLDQLSVFDPQATVQVARAFEMQPWVKQVTRVSKQPPANFEVELTYRKPVAMVAVQIDNAKLAPIDEEAIALPAADFAQLSQAEIKVYPRIHAQGTRPQGLVGDPWGDPRVSDAARIASLLSDNWVEWGLYRIHAIERSAVQGSPASTAFILTTEKWGEIVWGSGPGKEEAGEPNASVKIERLQQFVEQNGSLETMKSPDILDLRSSDLRPQTPRTASLEGSPLR